ncbi:CAP domain-containing protein [Micromonospora radicis]|uniref:SCP domain-containing protein n=1 Tax=Micromonospora radicis TaxID=1894971 RepID=A0A418N067_9ACTN|nr:CAP domain-containing protein [Micromonospora radicis]RIV40930.1 hypothetical protein D2L64_03520 [Micromonospora radicis]
MHGWNEPTDPEHTARRPEPANDDPAWLTDRPAPRSSYLFGDEPEPANSPADWYRDQPTEQWRPGDPATAERAYPEQDRYDQHPAWQPNGPGRADEPVSGYQGWSAEEPTSRIGAAHDTGQHARHAAPEPDQYDHLGRHDESQPHEHPRWEQTPPHDRVRWEDTQRYEDSQRYGEPQQYEHGRWDGSYDVPGDDRGGVTGPEPAAAAPRGTGRRLSRPLVMGGAAAAATLVVSIGVAALALPGDDAPTNTTAGDLPVATAPAAPEEEPVLPFDTLDSPSPSPSTSPSTAAASPSPSRTARPTPTPSRSNAASRQGVARQGAPSRSATAPAPATSSPSSGAGTQAAQVVELVNAERAKAGCGALSIDDKLMTAAQRHSQDQADNQNMSHTGSDGSDPGDRIDRVGYAWRTYGENVAWNQQTPAAVMDAWMNSDGHRANILNCAFTEIGVGVANSNGPYWTQVFAAPR